LKKKLVCALLVSALPASALPACAADAVARSGDVGQLALPAAAVLATALHHDAEGGRQLTRSLLSTLAVVYVLKATVERRRPDGGARSFPSGHTASAAAGAAFLQRRYGWRLGVPAYAAAAFVGWSRVESRHHYTSDVLVGGALGVGANLLFTKRYRNLTLAPVPGGVGLTVAW
jgi:membrane-associated phospholipid phosphatase